MIELDTTSSIWEKFFTVFPLVVIGTRESDGSDDLAPKHLAMPMSWSNHFGFVCTPRHNTWQNIERTRAIHRELHATDPNRAGEPGGFAPL